MIELHRFVDSRDEVLSIRLLQQFGKLDAYLTPQKIQEIWLASSQYDTLFSDYTRGDVSSFFDVLFNPGAVIAEIHSETQDASVGLLMLTNVIPRFDAKGHFTFWDKGPRDREQLIRGMLLYWMNEFALHRVSAQIPGSFKGVIRMVERIGFVFEGTTREGTIKDSIWLDLKNFGILRSELEELINE